MKTKEFFSKNKKWMIAVVVIFILSLVLGVVINHYDTNYRFKRSILFFFVGIYLYIIRPKSCIHKISIDSLNKLQKLMCIGIVIITIAVITYPMSLNEVWSKAGWGHHTQYEDFTESILRGHIYFDEYEVDTTLKKMDNPYDPHARNEEGASIRWDHAFYKGKYYMYFGVVPVIILFVPLKLLGITIIGSQATQIFSGLAVIGIFLLFYEMAKRLCPKMPVSIYIALSSAVSGMSLWYAIIYPALYCTAITAGVCLAIWGFYFCFKAFIVETTKGKTIRDAIFGALFSALVFGCRPTIGFISFAYIPMIWYFLNKNIEANNIKEWFKKVITKDNIQIAIAFCMPYIIVAILLMSYNYARFENPFEFGQSYQLTAFDQHNYMKENHLSFAKIIDAFTRHFLFYGDMGESFPYITYSGVFINFPILLMIFCNFNIFNKEEKSHEVKGLDLALLITVITICIFHVAWAPTVETRYSLDFNFVLGILVMLSACKIINNSNSENHRKISFKITILSSLAVIVCFLLYFVSFDYAMVDLNPDIIPTITTFLMIK